MGLHNIINLSASQDLIEFSPETASCTKPEWESEESYEKLSPSQTFWSNFYVFLSSLHWLRCNKRFHSISWIFHPKSRKKNFIWDSYLRCFQLKTDGNLIRHNDNAICCKIYFSLDIGFTESDFLIFSLPTIFDVVCILSRPPSPLVLMTQIILMSPLLPHHNKTEDFASRSLFMSDIIKTTPENFLSLGPSHPPSIHHQTVLTFLRSRTIIKSHFASHCESTAENMSFSFKPLKLTPRRRSRLCERMGRVRDENLASSASSRAPTTDSNLMTTQNSAKFVCNLIKKTRCGSVNWNVNENLWAPLSRRQFSLN